MEVGLVFVVVAAVDCVVAGGVGAAGLWACNKPARKTLEVIGISDFFEHIVGLDTCYKSKPAREPFEKALELTKTAAENAVAIGDRFDLDVQLPLRMGMGGIEVSGVEDLYGLNVILG